MEHDTAEHAVVVKNKSGLGGVENKMIVLLLLVARRRGEEFS